MPSLAEYANPIIIARADAPCPKCGELAHYRQVKSLSTDDVLVMVNCPHCGIETDYWEKKEETR